MMINPLKTTPLTSHQKLLLSDQGRRCHVGQAQPGLSYDNFSQPSSGQCHHCFWLNLPFGLHLPSWSPGATKGAWPLLDCCHTLHNGVQSDPNLQFQKAHMENLIGLKANYLFSSDLLSLAHASKKQESCWSLLFSTKNKLNRYYVYNVHTCVHII